MKILKKGVKILMNIRIIGLITLIVGSYYLLHSLGTTNTISFINIAEPSIQPNLIERLNFAPIIQCISQEAILAELDNQEKIVWTTLEKVINISKQKCDALKQDKEWIKEYDELVQKMTSKYNHLKPISEEIYNLVAEVIAEYKLDLKSITIAPWDELSPAGSTDKTLFINEESFKNMPLLVKKFILAHEVSHIVMKDHSTDFVIAKLKEIKNLSSKEFTQAIDIFSQFVEGRADILASLRNTEYAQGHIQFAEHELLAANTDYEDYPSDAIRLEIGKRILALYMNNNSNTL